MTLNVDQHFVDRKPERERFAQMLSGESDKRVLRVLVPAGHGKSWFVARLFLDCEKDGVPVVWLDFDARRSNRPVNASYVVERFLELFGEDRLPQTRNIAAELRKAGPSLDTETQYLPALGRALRDDLSHWTDAPSPIADEFTPYEAGISALLTHLEQTHLQYQEVAVYQQRLVENIAASRLYSDTDTRRSERSQILAQVRRITTQALGMSFDTLCSAPPVDAATHTPLAVLLDTFEQIPETVRNWISSWLFGGLRRDLAHVRVVVAGRPEPSCCAFFDQARLWGHLVADIGQFEPMPRNEVLEYDQRRGCSLEHVDTNTICFLAQQNAAMMAEVGNTLAQGVGD